jgi:hypothetical protein
LLGGKMLSLSIFFCLPNLLNFCRLQFSGAALSNKKSLCLFVFYKYFVRFSLTILFFVVVGKVLYHIRVFFHD